MEELKKKENFDEVPKKGFLARDIQAPPVPRHLFRGWSEGPVLEGPHIQEYCEVVADVEKHSY